MQIHVGDMVDESPSPTVKAAIRLLWPLFVLPYLLVKYLYKGVIGWWLDAWLTERDRRRLLRNIANDMPFLASNGNIVDARKSPQCFHDATVYLDIEDVRVSITRWRGEVSLSLAPHASLEDWFELGVVLEALGCAQGANESLNAGLREVDRNLELHWKSIKTEFSENHYLEFKVVLSKVVSDRRTVVRETQWQLQKHLARFRR